MNGEVLTATSGAKYKFSMPEGNVVIEITLKEKEVVDVPTNSQVIASYNFETPKTNAFTSSDAILNIFKLSSGVDIINGVDSFAYVYGGGYGGSGDNRWTATNLLKISSTSYAGSLTLDLATEINAVKITGYIHGTNCKIQVGGNELVTISSPDLPVINKDVYESNGESSITINFENTSKLTIATTNKVPLYITSIEFINTNYGQE